MKIAVTASVSYRKRNITMADTYLQATPPSPPTTTAAADIS
jgi:hypothetical protein